VIRTAVAIERSDEFNEARLLLLLNAAAEGQPRPVEGIMKLAKMDFLLRYPGVLAKALNAVGGQAAIEAATSIPASDKDTIEARMIRFRYGPWDWRYRRWLRILQAKQLAIIYKQGATTNIELTPKGRAVAQNLAETAAFKTLNDRAKAVHLAVGQMQATKVAEFIYKIVPEIKGLKWGAPIEI
jgi:hypothetical protein